MQLFLSSASSLAQAAVSSKSSVYTLVFGTNVMSWVRELVSRIPAVQSLKLLLILDKLSTPQPPLSLELLGVCCRMEFKAI